MEQKRVAIETYIRFELSCADAIAGLGYSLAPWSTASSPAR